MFRKLNYSSKVFKLLRYKFLIIMFDEHLYELPFPIFILYTSYFIGIELYYSMYNLSIAPFELREYLFSVEYACRYNDKAWFSRAIIQ